MTTKPSPVSPEEVGHDDVHGCDRCDTFGGEKTYANQVVMPLDGRTRCIDWCIHHIIAALNAANVRTTASCCGHGRLPGRIDLEDGRVLTITKPAVSNPECGHWVPTKGCRECSTEGVVRGLICAVCRAPAPCAKHPPILVKDLL